jgi:hypothetical protein
MFKAVAKIFQLIMIELMFPLLWASKISPCLSYQLLTATAHKD